MYILVLGSAETLTKNPTYYAEYAAFATAAMPEAVVDTALFDDLYIALGGGTFTVENLNKRRDLREYDLIMVRGLYFRLYIDMIKTVSTYAASHGVALINDQSSYRSGSKLDQAVRFHQENIPAPFTVMATTASLNMAEAELGITFPCIMKATLGAHGSDNHIVKTAEEARAIQICATFCSSLCRTTMTTEYSLSAMKC
jgi:glutathione synthase/RimK-type ligase-like ATP-grasp enzyme